MRSNLDQIEFLTADGSGFARVRDHLPEYAMEAFGLGLFMVSACSFGALLEHPASPVRQAIPEALWRRVLMGGAMGLTAVLNIYSPWGKRSGAHLNPATTLTFYRLGRVNGTDAICYALAQFVGGTAGVMLTNLVIGAFVAHPTVNYVATLPGPYGIGAAFLAEVGITFLLISIVLRVTAREAIAPFTGLLVGLLVAAYISVEAPVSGMSMNPARSFASAVFAQSWATLWLYFSAPPLGMLLAAEVYRRFGGRPAPSRQEGCAKLHHQNQYRCIFCGANKD